MGAVYIFPSFVRPSPRQLALALTPKTPPFPCLIVFLCSRIFDASSLTGTRAGAAATSKLSCLHSAHLLCPSRCGLRTADRADFVGAEAGDTDVVVSLENELDVTDLECSRATKLGQTTSSSDEIVDEVICNLEEDLEVWSAAAEDHRESINWVDIEKSSI